MQTHPSGDQPAHKLREPLMSCSTMSDRILHAGHFRDTHYKWYMLAARGYGRLFFFLLFWLVYVIVLIHQHNTVEVNGNTTAWRTLITQLKPDLTIKSGSAYWTFLNTKIVPALFTDTWTQERDGDSALHGSVALEYQYLVGGIAVTSVRNERKVCYRGQLCREDIPKQDPYLMLNTSDHGVMKIPYNDFYGGYTVYIPTVDKTQTTSLITMYQQAGLFDPSVNEMKVNWISFNPNHLKTITLLEFGAHISASGSWSISFQMDSMPYHLYPLLDKTPFSFLYRIIIETMVLVFAARLIYPLVMLWRSDEVIGVDKNILGMPCDRSGTPYWKTPTIMWSLMLFSWVIWIYIVSLSQSLPNFGSEKLDSLYSGSSSGIDSQKFQEDSLTNFKIHILPFYQSCTNFSLFFNVYSVLNGLIILIMTFRFFEYVSFQKRLSMITDTFAGISSELFHLFIVFVLVCFSFALVCLFTFGMLDPSFTKPINGFSALIAMCFGLFRAASTQAPSTVGLYKYAPHAVNPAVESFLLPEVIFILFKLLVSMMLFKFIIAMIMDSYKDNHKKNRRKARSVYVDLYDLCAYQIRRGGHFLLGRSFLCMEDLARALYYSETRESAITTNLLYDRDRLFDVVSRCPDLPQYSEEDVDWAVHAYGISRNQAILKEHKRRKMEGKLKKVAETDVTSHEARHNTMLVFERYDTLKVGFIEIADLNDALELIGYNDIAVDTKIMRRLIQQYDDNEDGVLEFAEFESMLKDEVFQLHFELPDAAIQRESAAFGREQSVPAARDSGASVYMNQNRTVVRYS